ncbi:hypothetical protein MLD38_001421 [Melastoma candidum]|uniref:Uncharacterized protein n=1 Tax=Melastoma candidum TaxID=119954 RepID=A0ACB9SE57_9MYRT|nr:hypothetical protein MLD38_001421 [Melastoma candidum]
MSRYTVNGDHNRQHVIRVNSWRRCCDFAGAVAGSFRKKDDECRRMPFPEGKVLVYTSLVSVFINVWYLYIPHKPFDSGCLIMDVSLLVTLLALGSCLDVCASIIIYSGSLFSVCMRRSAFLHVVGVLSILPVSQASVFFFLWLRRSNQLHILTTIISIRVFGAVWYILSLARIEDCWRDASILIGKDLNVDCGTSFTDRYVNMTDLLWGCNNGTTIDYGIYVEAIESQIVSSPSFTEKVMYCFWWAFQNISSLGQKMGTNITIWDELFVATGVLCFSLLIITMQAYLQPLVSTTPAKDWRKDLHRWKPFYALPKDTRKQILHHQTVNSWQGTGGVNLENLLHNVTVNLRRKIKSHLCSHAFGSVPVFEGMNDRAANSIRDRLRPVLISERTFVIQEGLPVFEMIFVVQGKLLIHSTTLEGDIPTVVLAKPLTEGDVCGEELLHHCLAGGTCSRLPIATRTIQSVTKVEAFAMTAWDLSYVVSRYRGLLFPSELETQAARTISEAWRRHRARNTTV